MNDKAILYLIPIMSMQSMQSGTMLAQIAHAANDAASAASFDRPMYEAWAGDNAYGTTIVVVPKAFTVHAEYVKLKKSIIQHEEDDDLLWGTTVDDTFPLKDGTFTHKIPVETVIWVMIFENTLTRAKLFNPAIVDLFNPAIHFNRG